MRGDMDTQNHLRFLQTVPDYKVKVNEVLDYLDAKHPVDQELHDSKEAANRNIHEKSLALARDPEEMEKA